MVQPAQSPEQDTVGVEALASLPKNQLVGFRKNNSPYYTILAIESILYDTKLTQLNSNKINSELVELHITNLKNIIGCVYSNNNCHRIVSYFINYGAATSTTLMRTLNLTRIICYYNLETLVKTGIIIEGRNVQRPKGAKGGPKVILYRTPDAKPEQIIQAEQTHEKLINPRYLSSEQAAQQIMDDFQFAKKDVIPEGAILAAIKGMNFPTNLLDLVCVILRDKYSKKILRRGL